MTDKKFKKNKKDIICNFTNLSPYKEQRKCPKFEQAGDDYNNQFECTACLIGRTSNMLCDKKMTTKQINYYDR